MTRPSTCDVAALERGRRRRSSIVKKPSDQASPAPPARITSDAGGNGEVEADVDDALGLPLLLDDARHHRGGERRRRLRRLARRQPLFDAARLGEPRRTHRTRRQVRAILRGRFERPVGNRFDQRFEVVATHVSDTPFRAGGAAAAWRGADASSPCPSACRAPRPVPRNASPSCSGR